MPLVTLSRSSLPSIRKSARGFAAEEELRGGTDVDQDAAGVGDGVAEDAVDVEAEFLFVLCTTATWYRAIRRHQESRRSRVGRECRAS